VKIAQDYSNLDTSDIDISRQKRTARQKKTFKNNNVCCFKNNNFVYSSASDDSNENNNTVSENQQMNEKIKTLPTPPPLPKSFIANIPTNNEVMQSNSIVTKIKTSPYSLY
jgi:hypothetical protein